MYIWTEMQVQSKCFELSCPVYNIKNKKQSTKTQTKPVNPKHTVTDYVKGPLKISLSTSSQSRVSYSRGPRTMSNYFLNISKYGGYNSSGGKQSYCLVTLTMNYFLMFKQSFLKFNFCPLPPFFVLNTNEKSLTLFP